MESITHEETTVILLATCVVVSRLLHMAVSFTATLAILFAGVAFILTMTDYSEIGGFYERAKRWVSRA